MVFCVVFLILALTLTIRVDQRTATVVNTQSVCSTQPSLHTVNSSVLAEEMQSRRYTWELLQSVGMTYADFSDVELVAWLRQAPERFKSVMRQASLGLGVFSSVELLKELSARPDLSHSLSVSGLGFGSDFSCVEDESPHNGGCQIRCHDIHVCARAHRVCAGIKHCVHVDVNPAGDWATLKSLMVFTPPAAPACEGYAFGRDGRTPPPITLSPSVQFEVAVPDENWCYRDMDGTDHDLHGNASTARHRCTASSCFDYERCRKSVGRNMPSLYIHPEVPRSKDMMRLPSCLEQVHSAQVVERHEDACLIFPTVNINCDWDVCDPATHADLRRLGSWGDRGRNHIIWDYSDARQLKYRTDDALFVKTSMSIDDYRPGFDVPFPLLPNGVATRVTPEELTAAASRRHILLSFKGTCQGSSLRPELKKLHNGRDIIIACLGEQYDYKTLMLTSTFSAAPAGNGLHSFRLAEAIFLGSIPVIVDAKLIMPFCPVLDWRQFSVRVAPHDILKLPTILRAISPVRITAMQQRLAKVKELYFLNPFSTALSLIGLRIATRLRNNRSQ